MLERRATPRLHVTATLRQARKSIVSSRYLYLMFLVPLAYYLLFKYGPMYGILIAFKEFNIRAGILRSPWVGLKYFRKFILEPYFWQVVRNTILLGIYNIVFSFPAPIVLALLINEVRSTPFKRGIQSVSYLPHFISAVVVCGMIVNFLSPDGPLNKVLMRMGVERTHFLMRAEFFRTIYISSGIWQEVGWGAIVYLAALSTVDPELYEAATVDGAGRWRQTVHVTIPGIVQTITIMFILTVGRVMTVAFEKVLLLYTPTTYETADVIQTYVYRRGLERSEFSYATAVETFSAVIALFFLITANQISKRLGETSLW